MGTKQHWLSFILSLFCSLYLAGCASALNNSKFSAQDRLSYPKASPDADRVITLISNKDNTRFFVDGRAIGSPISAGGELKILVNNQQHDFVAAASGYQDKLHHSQPPYDERSPISFSFIYKDKQMNGVGPTTVAIVAPMQREQQEHAQSENQLQPPVISKPPTSTANQVASPVTVKPPSTNTVTVVLGNNNERRIALVIGNGAYQYTGQLLNPANDAQDIAQALKKYNFQVILKTDASLEAMADAIFEFGEKLQGGGVGLFYYSGHGLQVKGENYLLPVDANLTREDDVKRKAINANDVLEKMGEGKSHLNLVFLDACRNNPFPSSTRAVSRGLAGMNAPNGTLLVYSTNPGNVAEDGGGRNGTYTKNLLQEMNQPGVEIGMLLRKVRTKVKEETGGKQVPWENGSIEGEFYFNDHSSP